MAVGATRQKVYPATPHPAPVPPPGPPAPAAPAAPLSPIKADFSRMTVKLLKRECDKRQIRPGRTKKDTKARLRQSDNNRANALGQGSVERLLHELDQRFLSSVGSRHKIRKRLARYCTRGFSQMRIEDLAVECRRRRLQISDDWNTMRLRICHYEFTALDDQFDPVVWAEQKLPAYDAPAVEDDDKEFFSENSENEPEYPQLLYTKKVRNKDFTQSQRDRMKALYNKRIWAVRDSEYINHLDYHPEAIYTQQNVQGEGNCQFRAFAVAYFGRDYEHLWTEVRRRTRSCYVAIVGEPPNRSNHPRRRLYTEMNMESTQVGTNSLTVNQRAQSPTTLITDENLAHQIHANAAWGTTELTQVIADAFDVEIFTHSMRNGEIWDTMVRGDPNASRQVHIVQWQNHWTALHPVDPNFRMTNHLANVDIRAPVYPMYGPGSYWAPGVLDNDTIPLDQRNPYHYYRLGGVVPPRITTQPRPWMDEFTQAVEAAASRGEDINLDTFQVPPAALPAPLQADAAAPSSASDDEGSNDSWFHEFIV